MKITFVLKIYFDYRGIELEYKVDDNRDEYKGLHAHKILILYMNSKHKNRNNYCLIYYRKLNIKTKKFESENNFCIENIP